MFVQFQIIYINATTIDPNVSGMKLFQGSYSVYFPVGNRVYLNWRLETHKRVIYKARAPLFSLKCIERNTTRYIKFIFFLDVVNKKNLHRRKRNTLLASWWGKWAFSYILLNSAHNKRSQYELDFLKER